MAEKNYYEILGVQKTATDDEIKKAFKKLAMQFHPDRFAGKPEKEQKEAEAKFKDINEAYHVLSDPKKRQEYDNPTPEGFPGFPPGFDPFGVFRRRSGSVMNIGSDVFINMQISIYEAYSGIKKKITYQREEHCPDCNGTGSIDGKEVACPHCGGTGMIKEESVNGYMHTINMNPCPYCNGTGKIVQNPCKSCNGTGLKIKTITEEVEIPKGAFNGAQLQINGLGNAPKGNGYNGNLILNISIAPDPYFTLDNKSFDIIHYENIKFNEAMLGCEREIRFIDGTTKKLTIHECTKDKEVIVYHGKGMFNVQQNYGYGDYRVIINYIYPTTLNKDQKKMLEEFKW